jgi:hypothetical protein
VVEIGHFYAWHFRLPPLAGKTKTARSGYTGRRRVFPVVWASGNRSAVQSKKGSGGTFFALTQKCVNSVCSFNVIPFWYICKGL